MGRRSEPGGGSTAHGEGGEDDGGAGADDGARRDREVCDGRYTREGYALPPPVYGPAAYRDRNWAPELRAAACGTATVLAIMLTVDLAAHTIDPLRAACWTAIAVVLFAALFPVRVTAGANWLAVRGLLCEHRVRTDLLVLVHRSDGMAPRLVLRDITGSRVELDPKALTGNPVLWHLLDTGARLSRERGLLRSGGEVLRALGERIDGDGARGVFEASGLR
ncbi:MULTISPECIES: hypothetical protein [Streptomyces]|uniref:hypothetical protein n=1 Tax=Streptomyces TaxID=1883 RepID=UPI000AC377A3|nr:MULTISPECIES: hypothetical protein [Streptomyces]